MRTGFSIGSLRQDAVTDIKSFMALVAINLYQTLETKETTDYQVPGGHSFYITKIIIASTDAGGAIALGYGTNGVQDSAVPPANPEYLARNFYCPVAKTDYEFRVYYRIPASQFPFILATVGTLSCKFFGVEIAD